jgi:hypothetical protein
MPNMNTARTLASVEQALTKMSLHSAESRFPGYLACRYAPFENSGSNGVPDGNGRNTTLRDYYSAFDIVTDSSGCDIVVVPWIPIQTLITSGRVGGKVTVNGTTFTRPSNTAVGLPIYGAHTSNTLSRLGNDPEQRATNDVHHISSGRIITVGFRLIYTGKASSCEGTLTADLFATKVDLVETSHVKVVRFLYDGTAAPVGYAADNARVASIELDVASSNLSPTSVVTRPEHGLQGVLSRRTSAKNNTFKPYHELGIIPVYDDREKVDTDHIAITASPSYTAPYCTGVSTCPTVSLFDDDFNVARIRIRTGEANSYRLEVMTCVQFEQGPSFPLISLTKGPTPRNDALLTRDDQLNGTLMAAAPLGQPSFHMGKVQALPQRVRRTRNIAARPVAPPNSPTRNSNRKRRQRRKRKQQKS